MSSHVTNDMNLVFVLVLNLATTFCFLLSKIQSFLQHVHNT